MKLRKILLATLVVSASGLALADDSANYRYSGDAVGRQVCRAIVQDDIKALQRLLQFSRHSVAYKFSNMPGRVNAAKFKCNDMDLQDFSSRVNALQALNYLSTGQVVISTQMASTSK